MRVALAVIVIVISLICYKGVSIFFGVYQDQELLHKKGTKTTVQQRNTKRKVFIVSLHSQKIRIPVSWIPSGSFLIGSPQNEPGRNPPEEKQHQVKLGKGFWMMQTETTQKHFHLVMGYNPAYLHNCKDCPIENVTWHEAQAFANQLSQLQGLELCFVCIGRGKSTRCKPRPKYRKKLHYQCESWRLPTEAEWEYAARAGNLGNRHGVLKEIAWYSSNSGMRPRPVGQKNPNRWGLYDMIGNVYEWCWDHYGKRPMGRNNLNPTGPISGYFRVIRGGAWNSHPRGLRAGAYSGWWPLRGNDMLGFRLVRTKP